MSRFRFIFVLLALSVAGCVSYPYCDVYKGPGLGFSVKRMDTCPDVNWVNGWRNPAEPREDVCFVSRRNKNEQMFKSPPDRHQSAVDEGCAIWDATEGREIGHTSF